MLKKSLFLALLLLGAFAVMLQLTRTSTFSVRDTLLIEQPAGRVWQVLADLEQWPRWWPGLESIRHGADWTEGEGFALVFRGNPSDGPARIERYQEEQELAFSRQGVLGSRVGTGFRLEKRSGAALVEVESVILGPQAFLARFTGRDAFADYQQRLLAALRDRVLQGAVPEMEGEVLDGR